LQDKNQFRVNLIFLIMINEGAKYNAWQLDSTRELVVQFPGEFYKQPVKSIVLRGDRSEKIYHRDNIHFEGQFSESTTSRDDFREVRGERVDIQKHNDNLHMEG